MAGLPQINVHLAEHCNLNCKGCNAFAPLVEEPIFADIEQYKKDIKRLSELFTSIDVITLLGGEPLLNKNIDEYIKISRESFPQSVLQIRTNGILLPRMPELFWAAMRQYDASVYVTLYTELYRLETAIIELSQRHGIRITIEKRPQFYKVLRLEGDRDKEQSFKECSIRVNCHFLTHGTMNVCGMASFLPHFNKYFSKNIPIDGVIDIHDKNITGEMIADTLFKTPLETCKYCQPYKHMVDWSSKSKRELSEWVAGM